MEGKVAGGDWPASEHSYIYYTIVLLCVQDMHNLFISEPDIVCIWRLEYRIAMQSFNAEILGFAFIIVLHVFVVSHTCS